ncbi:MAG: hypothetical protein AB7F36_11360 [Reyranellaceae bacterium]
MPSIRSLVVAVFLSLACFAPATAQQPHWLLGEWSGELANVSANARFGNTRTLAVTSVAPDGASAQGTWASAASKVPVAIIVAGDTVSFTSPGSGGAAYKLVRKGNKLDGTWETVGASRLSGNIALQKK